MYLKLSAHKQCNIRADSLPEVWAHPLWSILQEPGIIRVLSLQVNVYNSNTTTLSEYTGTCSNQLELVYAGILNRLTSWIKSLRDCNTYEERQNCVPER